MDLVPVIDSIGEGGTALVGGVVLGLLFGFFAQQTAFCTRSAVLDLTRRRGFSALAIWFIGFAVAILGVQLLLANGSVDVSETRFFSTAQSLSGALIGGLVFGIGMVLARGCVSRLLVLGAAGNLRAIFTVFVIGLVGLGTYDGVLVPLRDGIGGLWNTAAIGGNDLLVHAALPQSAGVWLGAILALAALALAIVTRLPVWKGFGAAIVGLTIVGGWYFTYTLSTQVFEPIQAESLSFIRPLATTGALAGGASSFGLDQGLLIGTLLGAFIASLALGSFRIATFSEAGAPSIVRYAIGGVLMGFGGILAVGCTIGAGLTGGSVLAVSSLTGLAAMVVGAAIADRVIDGRGATRPATEPFPLAAE
ncbi:YeeE/YedE family protein [Pseudaminobacter arsenicus]|uniref:YeeE/YedE family protein n=1 Tax=Borborobacter arsenicus TaxID=1851146 RepID=A0A432V0S5_9HYPH|nr:YeeE/YedE family protein [Pseudaminobacter arsenicus]RUM95698.1 YeeE/YedE family protein [Pseudaminobacter arsenicus]